MKKQWMILAIVCLAIMAGALIGMSKETMLSCETQVSPCSKQAIKFPKGFFPQKELWYKENADLVREIYK